MLTSPISPNMIFIQCGEFSCLYDRINLKPSFRKIFIVAIQNNIGFLRSMLQRRNKSDDNIFTLRKIGNDYCWTHF